MLFRMDLRVIALIGIILLIGIVKKNAILMIDFALAAERTRQEFARRHFRGLPPPFPAHPDDNDGGAARRATVGFGHGRWLGTQAASRRRDCRRIDFQPDAYPLHHSRRVSLYGSLPLLVGIAPAQGAREYDSPGDSGMNFRETQTMRELRRYFDSSSRYASIKASFQRVLI